MFLTVSEAAERLKVSKSCVYQLIEQGRLPCHRVGSKRGAIRISETDLKEHLTKCRSEKETNEKPQKITRPKLKHLKLS